MENDYKKNIVKFITGNLKEQPGTNSPQFNNVTSITNNLFSTIKSYFSSMVIYTGFIPSKNNKNQNLNYSVIACWGTLISKNVDNGMIIIVDKDYNIVKTFTEYSDNSNIGLVQCLSVDDKGNYYLVEDTGTKYRIVLMNNLTLKPAGSNTYQAIKVETHDIPNQYTWEKALRIFKNDSGNKYFVVINRDNADGIVGCELTTGQNDSWKYYTSDLSKTGAFSMLDNGYNVYWNSNGDLNFQIMVHDAGLVMLSKGNSTTMTKTRFTNIVVSSASNFIFYSNKIGYYAYILDGENQSYTSYNLAKVDLETKALTSIYTKKEEYTIYPWFWLFKNNNSICFYKAVKGDNANNYNLNFGLIDNCSVYQINVGNYSAITFYNAFCYPNIITEYNKNYLYIQNQDTLFTLDYEWNENDYNGTPYNGINSLVPNKMAIQDENNVEIFNRNIYNLSTYANWYTASMNVPNYYLNNNNINSVQLYSQANSLISNNTIAITKNIYEELNINVINKLNIYDNNVHNLPISIQVMQKMMQKDENVILNKMRLNYHDETNEIRSIGSSDVTYTTTSSYYNANIHYAIYVPKQIDTIDLLSNDEQSLYITINASSLVIDKYYSINTNLRAYF